MIRNLLRFAGWRQLRVKPVRGVLTVLGVALGVALFVAISAINGSTLDFFRENVSSMTGKASFTVLGSEVGFAEEVVPVVKAVPGVASAVPMIEARVRHGGKRTLVVLGIDLLQESAVRQYQTSGANEEVIEDPLEFLNQEDSIIVAKPFAAEHGLKIESPLELLTAHGQKRFVVRGLLEPTGAAKAYGGGVAIMDIDGARVMFGKEGKVDRIDVVPAEGVDQAELAARIQAAIGPGLRVERQEAQTETMSRMVEGYQGLLGFLSSLALLVGMFLVANTVSLAVADRRREIAVLRALGATRAGILGMFLVEAALLAAVGSALGVLLGRGLAEVLVEHVSSSMSRQVGSSIQVTEVHFRTAHAVGGMIAGVLTAVVAALWPAWQAARVRGSEAFGAGPAGTPPPKHVRRAMVLRLAGVAMLAALAAIAAFDLIVSHPELQPLNPILGALGAALAAPWIVATSLRGFARLVSPTGPLRRLAVLRLATENLLRHPDRTGGSVLSLVVGLMLVIIMAIVQQSFETSIDDWQARTLKQDLIVSSFGRVASGDVQPLADDLAAKIDEVPGVDVVGGKGARGFRVVHHLHEGQKIVIKAFDPQHPRIGHSIFDVTDRDVEAAGNDLFDPSRQTVMVSPNFVTHFHKQTGDTLELDTPTGRQSFLIVGVMVDFASPTGVVYLRRELYERVWRDSLVTCFTVEVAAGYTAEQVRDAIDAHVGGLGLVTTSNAELRAQLGELMDESFGFTRAIQLAALGVGLLGLLSTLLMSLMERLRELGMLRAIGMSRGQLVRMILGEATLLGVFGGGTAALLGAYVAHLFVVSSLATQLGWEIHVHIPWGSLLTTVGTGLLVGLLAGAVSARRMASLEIRAALETS